MTNKTSLQADPQAIDIEITIQHKEWPDMETILSMAVRKTLEHTEVSEEKSEVSIVLADNDFVKQLNKTYRGKDRPTNVLSFPQNEDNILGDIILAYETIAEEANTQNKSFTDHAVHLTVHGFLHLLGLDHETEKEAQEMESVEIKILENMGIKNPYETKDSMQ